MNLFNQLPIDTKCIKLPVVININGILYLPNDLKSIFDKTLEWDSKYLVTINTSGGLPLTKDGIPFPPLKFNLITYNNLLNNLNSSSIIPRVPIINEGANYVRTDHNGLKFDSDDLINWPSLKTALEDRIRLSDLVKYDENISSNISLSLVCIKL